MSTPLDDFVFSYPVLAILDGNEPDFPRSLYAITDGSDRVFLIFTEDLSIERYFDSSVPPGYAPLDVERPNDLQGLLLDARTAGATHVRVDPAPGTHFSRWTFPIEDVIRRLQYDTVTE